MTNVTSNANDPFRPNAGKKRSLWLIALAVLAILLLMVFSARRADDTVGTTGEVTNQNLNNDVDDDNTATPLDSDANEDNEVETDEAAP